MTDPRIRIASHSLKANGSVAIILEIDCSQFLSTHAHLRDVNELRDRGINVFIQPPPSDGLIEIRQYRTH